MAELLSETDVNPLEFRIVRLDIDPWPEVLRHFFERQSTADRSDFFLGEALLSELKWVDVAEYYGLVRPKGPGLIGFMGAWFVESEAEIHQIFLDPAFRKKGLGTLLLHRFMRYTRDRSVGNLYLEVRRSNRLARSLYRKMGFVETGERKGYYTCPREDAVLMGCRLCPENAIPSRAVPRPSMEGTLCPDEQESVAPFPYESVPDGFRFRDPSA